MITISLYLLNVMYVYVVNVYALQNETLIMSLFTSYTVYEGVSSAVQGALKSED